MYGLALRTALSAAQGPVAGQTYRAEELNRDSLPPAPALQPQEEREVQVLTSKEQRADDFKLRLKLRKATIAAEKEKRREEEARLAERAAIAEVEARFAAEDKKAAAVRPVVEKPKDPYANMDLDFDFEGDGIPFRFARGKASRVPGGKEGVRLARAQLRGEEPMQLAMKDGSLKHTGPTTPFSGPTLAGLASQQDVRTELRDFIVGWIQDNLGNKGQCWGPEGLRYASMGSQKLLLDLEILEQIRALGIRIHQVCLIDTDFFEPSTTIKQALREFADWQRASAQVSQQEPAEILAFSSLEDYFEVSEDGRRAYGCHVFLHCQAAWGESVVLDRRRQMIRGMSPGGLFTRLINDYSQKQVNSSLTAPENAEGWFSFGAWTIAPGKPPSITPLRKTEYAGVLGAIANVDAATVTTAAKAAEARQKALRERERAAQQKRMEEQAKAEMQRRQEQAAAAKADEEVQAASEFDDLAGTSVWRVVFKPHVAVRAAPRRTAMIVGALYPGEEVPFEDAKRVDNWLCISRPPKRPPGAEIPPGSYIMADSGDGQQVFLEPL